MAKQVSAEPAYIYLYDAAKYLGVTPPTIARYVKRGYRGIRLKTVKVGGMKRTTKAFCDAFVRACSELDK